MTHKRKQQEIQLDDYELELEENIGKSGQLSEKQKEKHIAALKRAANNYVKKDKRISIRVYSSDLEQIKRIALDEGLPYQTLITSILHKFATGRLSSRTDTKS